MVSERIVGRPQYIEQLKKWQSQTDLIKIVTGVRRCGKSKLFYLYQFDLIVHKVADDSQIININLEDLMQTQKIGLEYDKENFLPLRINDFLYIKGRDLSLLFILFSISHLIGSSNC